MTQLAGQRIVLHGYWRSSSSYRVRIALAFKGVAYEQHPVNLLAGEQRTEAFGLVAPGGLVPALRIGDRIVVESLAVCELLDELVPQPPLLPADPFRRSLARSMALVIASRIQPFQNLSVLQQVPQAERAALARKAIEPGLAVLEALVARDVPAAEGPFCTGAQPTLADVCLVPQLYAARRFSVDLGAYPRLVRADAAARELPAFQAAHPDLQPDAIQSA